MTSPGFEARNWVGQAVTGMTGGAGAPSSRDPLAALAALVSLRAAVTQAERDAARRAREDGKSWGEIGEALGFADDPQPGMTSVAEHAYHHVLPGYRGISPDWVTWTCPACGESIRDYGPELPPGEAEKGHVRTCPRFAATVAAWEDQWRDE